jgi:hypothetical protein
MYVCTVFRMNSSQATSSEADPYAAAFSCVADRILLHLTLAVGYAFLGFFGWLLTL